MKNILLLSLLLLPFNVSAQVCGQDCIDRPSCAELGYKQNITCTEGYITCPFDSSYKWCKQYTCKDGYYYDKPVSSFYIICEATDYHGNTCYDCRDCSDYRLSSCPRNAICSACGFYPNLRYRFDGCEDGFVQYGNTYTCVAAQCSDYGMDATLDNGTKVCKKTERVKRGTSYITCYSGCTSCNNLGFNTFISIEQACEYYRRNSKYDKRICLTRQITIPSAFPLGYCDRYEMQSNIHFKAQCRANNPNNIWCPDYI